MDDVIFSGNTGRPARNHAEVAVSIEQQRPQGALGLQRFRNAGRLASHHARARLDLRVNGREVRARDVAILFADASTGVALAGFGPPGPHRRDDPGAARSAPARAGRSGRHFGLHARRHEAELRLKAAEHNLTRVEDVIGAACGAGRFAGKPKPSGGALPQYSGQVRRTEALLFHLRWLAAQTEVGEAEHTRDEAVRVVAARTSEQTDSQYTPDRGRGWPAGVARGRGQGGRGFNGSSSRARRSSARKPAPRSASRSSTAGSSNLPPTSRASADYGAEPKRRCTGSIWKKPRSPPKPMPVPSA